MTGFRHGVDGMVDVTTSVRQLSAALRSRRRRQELGSDRRAGAHSRRELMRLRRAWLRRSWRAVLVIASLSLLSSLAALVFLPDSVAPYVVGALLASGAWLNYVFMLQTGGVMSHVLGVMGEQWTADELRKLRRRGWTIVNHVMLERRDVDHLALGPRGFFTIETKFRSSVGRVTDDQLAEWAAIAGRSARGVRPRLRTDRRVQPIIAVWGPGARDEYPEPLDVEGVIVCAGVDLVHTILSSEARIEPHEVAIAFDHIDRYVATRDRGEAREHGEPARSLADYTFDFLIGTLAAMVALWVIFASASLPPGGLWMLSAAMVIGGGALLARSRFVNQPRLLAVTTGCLAASAGALLLLVVLLAVDLLE
jgi:hypothetical protein